MSFQKTLILICEPGEQDVLSFNKIVNENAEIQLVDILNTALRVDNTADVLDDHYSES